MIYTYYMPGYTIATDYHYLFRYTRYEQIVENLYHAISEGNIEVVKSISELHSDIFDDILKNRKTSQFFCHVTPLSRAVSRGKLRMIKFLIQKGVSLEDKALSSLIRLNPNLCSNGNLVKKIAYTLLEVEEKDVTNPMLKRVTEWAIDHNYEDIAIKVIKTITTQSDLTYAIRTAIAKFQVKVVQAILLFHPTQKKIIISNIITLLLNKKKKQPDQCLNDNYLEMMIILMEITDRESHSELVDKLLQIKEKLDVSLANKMLPAKEELDTLHDGENENCIDLHHICVKAILKCCLGQIKVLDTKRVFDIKHEGVKEGYYNIIDKLPLPTPIQDYIKVDCVKIKFLTMLEDIATHKNESAQQQPSVKMQGVVAITSSSEEQSLHLRPN